VLHLSLAFGVMLTLSCDLGPNLLSYVIFPFLTQFFLLLHFFVFEANLFSLNGLSGLSSLTDSLFLVQFSQ
jgi:hypothetical protein